jgi:hypothetical protein
MDYLATISLIGSGVQGKSGKAMLTSITPDIPNEIDVVWCAENAEKIEAWLSDTSSSCIDVAMKAYEDIQPIANVTAVRKLRALAMDCHTPFPDCLLRALSKIATEYKTLHASKSPDMRHVDRVCMKISELCHLYALRVRSILTRHKNMLSMYTEERKLITDYLNDNITEEEKSQLAKLLGTTTTELKDFLTPIIKRADDTLWVLRDDPL